MTDDLRSPLQHLIDQPDAERAEAVAALPFAQLKTLWSAHRITAHAGQMPPPGDWTTWLILAGRGYGKTQAGAAWVDACARSVKGAHIAVVGATLGDARSVMVEGDAGILAVAAARPRFEPSRRLLTWRNGSTATLFGAVEPDSLRGPSFNFAWGDEAAKWGEAESALANLRLALRRGTVPPRLLLTTTPRPLPWLKALAAPGAPGIAVTRGRTDDNSGNLPAAYLAAMVRDYGGTRFGRQELHGEIIDDIEGALWTRAMFEAHRVPAAPAITRTVIGVDPPVSAGGKADACGIVVVGMGVDGRGYVLADRSVQGLHPEEWARAVVATADAFDADRVIAEVNNGGNLIEANLRALDATLPLVPVRAVTSKTARAEPVAILYSTGRISHVGGLAALEDELCGMITGGGYAGPGRSPDRADALVWALTELLLGKAARVPAVRGL